MDKKMCAIVQDLLVLYEDDVLAEESKRLVEEHILECEECRKIYESAGNLPEIETIEEKSEREQEAEAVAIMKKAARPKISLKKMCIIAVFLIVFLIFDTIFGYATDTYGIADYLRKVPVKNIKIENIYQLSNGDIYCSFTTPEKLGENSDYEVQKLIERNTDDADLTYVEQLSFRRRLWPTPYYQSAEYVFETETIEISPETGKEYLYRCPEIQITGKNRKDKIVVWKEGQKIEHAPREVEIKVMKEYLKKGELKRAFSLADESGVDIQKIIEELEKENAVAIIDCWAEKESSEIWTEYTSPMGIYSLNYQ